MSTLSTHPEIEQNGLLYVLLKQQHYVGRLFTLLIHQLSGLIHVDSVFFCSTVDSTVNGSLSLMVGPDPYSRYSLGSSWIFWNPTTLPILDIPQTHTYFTVVF